MLEELLEKLFCNCDMALRCYRKLKVTDCIAKLLNGMNCDMAFAAHRFLALPLKWWEQRIATPEALYSPAQRVQPGYTNLQRR